MNVELLTDEEKKAYVIYEKLREYASMANIVTLKQISVYIVRSNFVGDIDKDIKIENLGNSDVLVISLNNGIKIQFYNTSEKFDFVVYRDEDNYSMNTFVSLRNPDDVSTVNVYSELRILGIGLYVVTFRPKDINNEDTLNYATISFWTDDEIDWVREVVGKNIADDFDIVARANGIYPFAEKSEFDLFWQDDIALDDYHGCVSNVLTRIDLLYDNVKCVNVKKKKRVK